MSVLNILECKEADLEAPSRGPSEVLPPPLPVKAGEGPFLIAFEAFA